MDAFFASVEQRDDPSLRGLPVVVGGGGPRGVIAAASYEARKFGIHSAMPSATARRLCPELVFVKSSFNRYKEVSIQVNEIFSEFTDLIEPLSLDEAYLDVTTNKMGMPSASLIATEIRHRIFSETGLTASAGISLNKFLAKTASDVNKPNGQFLIPPDEVENYVSRMPIERFHGIGKRTAAKMSQMGIFTGKDLRTYSEEDLVIRFGKSGRYYYRICRGIDDRQVNPHRIRKSIGAENTFTTDITRHEDIYTELNDLALKVAERMKRTEVSGRTLTLKIRFQDFQTITRSRTLPENFTDDRDIMNQVPLLLDQAELEPDQFRIRLLGISVSQLDNDTEEEEISPPNMQLTISF